jgi:molybdopterin-guanine dinucleotide biosynthesis protein B
MNAIDPTVTLLRGIDVRRPAVVGIVGTSGSGKTTLLEDLVTHLRCDGLTVSAIKRTHDGFDLDRPGKDSYRLREAGCGEVMLVSDRRWALLHEKVDDSEPDIDSLLDQMAPVDLVLLEGFRAAPVPCIEVFRPSVGRPALWPRSSFVVAVATDEPLACDRPVLDLSDTSSIAEFVRSVASVGFQEATMGPMCRQQD